MPYFRQLLGTEGSRSRMHQHPLLAPVFSSSSRRSRSLRSLAFFAFLPSSMETVPPLSSPIDATDASAAAADQEAGILLNPSVPDASGEGESQKESGFERAEFGREVLVGTVQSYDRHVFLRYKSPEFWLPNVEAAESGGLPWLLAAAIKARKNDMKYLTRLTICGADDNDTSDGDVLIFPERIGFRGLTDVDVDNFVESVLVKDTEWLPGAVETLTGSYVFVCAHGSRDKRCGVCGPILIDKFKEEILVRGLEGQVFVNPCSHVGGHKYAGNVIIFSPSKTGEVSGHWYGYVSPDDVPTLLEQHIGKGEIIDHLWRGRMGLSKEEQKEAQKARRQPNTVTEVDGASGSQDETIAPESIPNHTGISKATKPATTTVTEVDAASGCCQGNGNPSCCQNATVSPKSLPNHTCISKATKPATTTTLTEVDVASGCCQGNGNPSCCQNATVSPKSLPNHTDISKTKKTATTGGGGRKTSSLSGLFSMPGWLKEPERDTFAVLAVVTAIVAVGGAYYYRRLN